MTPIELDGLTIERPVLLAPLAGVTDFAFRSIARDFGAGLTYTEMVSAKGLVYGSTKTEELLYTAENERPCAVQLFGSDPDVFRRALETPELEKFSLIDINMGCPVPKIVKNGEGSALMLDPKRAERVVRACVEASYGRPVTVKFRKGFTEDTSEDFALRMQDAGAAMLTVHGRTREQMYSGHADWACIARVVKRVKVPVIANGDVFGRESAEAVLRETGAAGVMVARGALGRPWIFRDIAEGESPVSRREVVLRHIELLAERFPERFIVAHMRKHIAWYAKGLPHAAEVRARVNACQTLGELQEIAAFL